jgi:SpoIIAA-like
MGGGMIERLSGLPDGIVGFEVTGKVSAEDFRDVVLPEIEKAAQSGEVRFVVIIPEFRGITPGALWQDLKVAFENFRKWKRIALITDIQWMHHMTTVFGWMTPGDVKTFPISARDQAVAWVSD